MDDDLFSESELDESGMSVTDLDMGASEADEGDNGWDIHTNKLDELRLDKAAVTAIDETWHKLINSFDSTDAAGDAIYGALFDSAPSLQALFVTPRAVQALRFMVGLQGFVQSVDSPSGLKASVETLGFGHLNIDVSVPRVIIFRDALLDLFDSELGEEWTSVARDAWGKMLSYIGGGLIFIRANYAERLKVLSTSWKAAHNRGNEMALSEAERKRIIQAEKKKRREERQKAKEEAEAEGTELETASNDSGLSGESGNSGNSGESGQSGQNGNQQEESARCCGCFGGGKASESSQGGDTQDASKSKSSKGKKQTDVPKTFEEMFVWNSAVMGLSGSAWMTEILENFPKIVQDVSDSKRLQLECNILAIKIGKCANVDTVNLAQFKSCMLAALRSLLPKAWDSAHEVAWNWLWDNVEVLLKKHMGQPAIWERELENLLQALTEQQLYNFRKDLYERFFTAAPAGQDYFKQSNTRLHFIAERVTQMTLDLYKEPWRMVDDISALGLRHVGYAIPTELFAPFVTATVEVLQKYAPNNPGALEGFRWSLGLIAQMLVQTITEGSTIVMKAINVNSASQMSKAVACAPRGERSNWVLIVQVGTQNISPLLWSIESGSLDAARAMLDDLLTIRADRERYYYGVEDLFKRHPDIIDTLSVDAVSLLPTFLEGLVWRSRVCIDNMRRCNYYVKNLITDRNGGFAGGMAAIASVGDPDIISHAVCDLCSNTLWNGIVMKAFIIAKIWFIFSLIVLMCSQTLLTQWADIFAVRCAIFACRVITYLLTMSRLLVMHTIISVKAYASGSTAKLCGLPVPKYLLSAYPFTSFSMTICLIFMCAYEPFFFCYESPEWPTEYCDTYDGGFVYSVFAMLVVAMHWALMADLAVFATGLSAFVLVCLHVGSEIGRFMFALLFLLLTFASAISVLEHNYEDMSDVVMTLISLSSITLRLYEDDYRDFQHDPLLLTAVFSFVTASAILLLNLLIAQLNCSYVYIYQSMAGYARLKRVTVICEVLVNVKQRDFARFVGTLGLDQPLEFNQGDVGMAGGMQILEPQSANVVTKDRIQRFGGSCAPELPWPEDQSEHKGADEEEQMLNLEKLMKTALSKIATMTKKKRKKGQGSSSGMGSSGAGHSSSASGSKSGDSVGSDIGDF
eukprot:TRINITY_DN4327_c0_g1_i2.p1 TRINITY_DN4327_c0_g1~~TRINITY_DN4327_c0_g1_i2.p1  ORF type:complete len:1143 (+),score=249.93 TRINITY_DN4327_c0_g1_i2:113-3541(+)